MAIPLHVLIIESSENEAGLILDRLQKAGFALLSERVETGARMKTALHDQAWDIIFCADSLPEFSAASALTVFQESGLDIPFMIITEVDREETTLDLMQAGASDVLLKGRLTRLAAVVRRELSNAQALRERRQAEAALKESRKWSDFIYNSASDSMFLAAIEPGEVYRLLSVNTAYLKSTGLSETDVVGKRLDEIFQEQHQDPGYLQYILSKYQEAVRVGRPINYTETAHLPGGTITVETTLSPVFDQAGRCTHLLGSSRDITEPKRAEEALRISEIKYKTLFEALPLAVTVSDKAGNILESNKTAQSILGLSKEEHEKRKIDGKEWSIIKPDGLPFPPDEFASTRALKEGRLVENVEMGLIKEGDEVTWINVSATPIPLEDFGVLIAYTDITARKQAEEALRESELKLSSIISKSRDAIGVSKQGIHTLANPAYVTLFGYESEAEVLEKSVLELIAPSHRSQILSNIQQRARGEAVSKFYDTRGLRKDDSEFDMEVTVSNYDLLKETYTLVIIRDITEHKRLDEALRQSEEKFSTAFHTSPDSININRLSDGLYIDINEGFTAMTGYSAKEVIGKTSLEINIWVNPQDRERLVKMLREQGEVKNLEAPFRIKNGSVKICLMSARIIELNQEKCILSITRDISERKQAEEALRESEQNFRKIFNSTNEAISINDVETGEILDVNDPMLKMYGYECKEDIQAVTIADLSANEEPPFDDKQAQALTLKTIEEGPQIFEWLAKRRDGSSFWSEVSLSRTQISGKARLLTVVRDITQRKQAELQINEQLEELRRWHAATLGREERILELKREVNRLCAEGGKPALYPSAQEAEHE